MGKCLGFHLWVFTENGVFFHPQKKGMNGGGYQMINFDRPIKILWKDPPFFMGKPWENHGKMVIYMERSTMLLMVKLTISTGPWLQ
jgi:hypothetical protein